MGDLNIFGILTGLLLTAYGGYLKIFSGRIDKNSTGLEEVDKRIDLLEKKPPHSCQFPGINERVLRVEKEVADTRPLLIDIRTRLMEVQTDLKWIKKN